MRLAPEEKIKTARIETDPDRSVEPVYINFRADGQAGLARSHLNMRTRVDDFYVLATIPVLPLVVTVTEAHKFSL